MPPVRVVAVALAALGLAGCSVNLSAEHYTTKEEKVFQVSGTPELVLSTFDGSIEVRSWDKPEIQATFEKVAESAEVAKNLVVKAEQSGNRITIEAVRPEPFSGITINSSRSVNLILSVPRKVNLQARSGDGGVRLEGLEGRIDVKSGDGGINGHDLAGDLYVRTGDGSVTLDSVKGRLDLNTGDGGIQVDGALTRLSAHTGDGSVTVRAAQGSRTDDDWDVTSGDGSVTVELPEGFSASVDAHTGDGGITVEGLALPSPTGESKDTLRGSLGTGGKTLRLRTGDGGIRLRKS